MELNDKQIINSFHDLEVYNNAYKAMLEVHHEILPKLPGSEKYDLFNQLLRSSKAVPRLIAEGYAKKHQKAGFRKYLDDARTESNETIVSLEQCKDLYFLETGLINKLVDNYDKISRQLFKLAEAWEKFENRRRKPPPPNVTHRADA